MSYSKRETLERDAGNKRFRVWYSEPKAAVRHRSAAHHCIADWDDNRNKLVGRHYNDRGSSGDIDIKRTKKS